MDQQGGRPMATLEDVEAAHDQSVERAAEHISRLVAERGSLSLRELMDLVSVDLDPSVARDALAFMLYRNNLVLTEDRQVTA